MERRLTNIRDLGRYRNVETGKEYNVKKGRSKERSIDYVFYLYRGTRVIIPDNEFYSKTYEKFNR